MPPLGQRQPCRKAWPVEQQTDSRLCTIKDPRNLFEGLGDHQVRAVRVYVRPVHAVKA
jgi:hypothetical protein